MGVANHLWGLVQWLSALKDRGLCKRTLLKRYRSKVGRQNGWCHRWWLFVCCRFHRENSFKLVSHSAMQLFLLCHLIKECLIHVMTSLNECLGMLCRPHIESSFLVKLPFLFLNLNCLQSKLSSNEVTILTLKTSLVLSYRKGHLLHLLTLR